MAKKKKKVKKPDPFFDPDIDMNDDFSFIAGYTSNGAPYGTAWEDVGIDPDLPFNEKKRLLEVQNSSPELTEKADELPF